MRSYLSKTLSANYSFRNQGYIYIYIERERECVIGWNSTWLRCHYKFISAEKKIYIEVCIFKQQVIQVSFVKVDGTLFISFNFIFSRLLIIFLVSGS